MFPEVATEIKANQIDLLTPDVLIESPAQGFSALNLAPALIKGLEACGYQNPTPVQQQAIPLAISGRDLMVSSATGSGKTAAFMLPALHRLAKASAVDSKGPRILVLTPTRELALQVTSAAETYGRYLRKVRTVAILGGMPYPVQNRLLRQPVDVLVATPGRLLDHLQRGRVDFARLELLVLDEADRMLDMGFSEDIDAIVAATPADRQTLLFSATLEGSIARLATRMLREPTRIRIASDSAPDADIEQRLHFADDLAHKNRLLCHMLRDVAVNQAVVFTATKRDAEVVAGHLSDQGFSAAALHGDMRQGERTRTLNALRRGGIKVLVATDVAARGIDVHGVSHVINFDLPRQGEDYVHRIGRTGRAGRHGVAITLASGKEAMKVRMIERYTTKPIPVHTIPGLEPRFTGHRASAGTRRPSTSKPGVARTGRGHDAARTPTNSTRPAPARSRRAR